MNLSPQSETRRSDEQNQGFKSRLRFDHTVYKSASEALEAYIAQFEGGRSVTTYRRRPSDLLSPAPKYYFMDSLERSLRSPPSKSPARKVDELLEWVNVAYAKELSSRVAPFGYRTTPELPGSDEENMNPHPGRGYRSHKGIDDELSTLPSPSSSVVDLDSNAGTVETEVLLSSFKGSRPSTSGSYHSKASLRSPPKSGPVKNRSRPDGSTEYPSWVSGLGKEYPSWVEDLDTTARHRHVKQSPDKKYSSSTSSTSETDTKRRTFVRSSRSTPGLKVSDLQSRGSYPSRRPMDPTRVKMAESRMNGVDWNDGASTDTDMLVSQSVYGPTPVNMGGDFHNSLYHDKKVARLKKESTKKLRKSTGKVKSREQSSVSPRRSKSLTYTPTKTLRFSTRDEYSEGRESTPLRTNVLRDSSPEGSPFTALPPRYSLPPQNERYGTSEEAGRRSVSPQFNRMYVSPPNVTRYSNLPAKKAEVKSSPTKSRQQYTSSSPIKSPSRASIPLKIDLPPRTGDSDAESDDTDRVMRKSPTGIKMEKMYRDPNTMYPWKTMIQSSRSQDGSAAEPMHPKPQYYSTPMVYTGRETQKTHGSPGRHTYSSSVPHSGYRSDPKVSFSEPRSQQREMHARTMESLKSTPKPVFASSSYRSRDEKLAKTAPDARYRKPPPAPTRSTARKASHRRSKTVPDLRRIAISSASKPRNSRRSLDDDVISVNTADTEILITHPPMPLFDVSPSLTTVSDSDTLVESETETETDIGVSKRHHLSPRHMTHVLEVQDENDKFSPTSVFASTNPHAAVREELPQRFHLWKLDEDTKAPESFIRRRFTSPKSGIISSFLEDCLSVDSDDKKITKPDSSSPPVRLSGKEAAPGPVEALKQMLFTMQDMAHHETLDNGDLDYYKASPNVDFKSRDTKDSLASDDQSERDADIFRGEVSLQRAYHHLERLKRLVGKEDDRSSLSSAN
ncbi:uncharacterized protein LOC144658050 [Oculina patagonica]